MLVRLTSGLAFRFDPVGFLLRSAEQPVPDPTLPPEGCPGHPIVTDSIIFPFVYDEALKAKRTGKGSMMPALRLLTLYGHDGPTRTQDSDLRLYKEVLESATGTDGSGTPNTCVRTEEGLQLCYSCVLTAGYPRYCATERYADGSLIDISKMGFWGAALPGIHVEYADRPFSVHCYPVTEALSIFQTCDVSYQLSDGLSVTYEFDAQQVPVTGLIGFDKAIRGQIMSARSPEFDEP